MKHQEWARIAGYGVIESERLPFDGIIVSGPPHRIVVVGELAHFSYRLQNAFARRELEARVDKMIDDLAQWAGVDSPVQKH